MEHKLQSPIRKESVPKLMATPPPSSPTIKFSAQKFDTYSGTRTRNAGDTPKHKEREFTGSLGDLGKLDSPTAPYMLKAELADSSEEHLPGMQLPSPTPCVVEKDDTQIVLLRVRRGKSPAKLNDIRRSKQETGFFETKIDRHLSVQEDFISPSRLSASDSELETGQQNELIAPVGKPTWDEKTAVFESMAKRKTSEPTMEDRGTMLRYYLTREESKRILLSTLKSKFSDLRVTMNTDQINKAYDIVCKLYALQDDFFKKLSALEPLLDNPNTQVAEIFRCVIQRQEYLVSYHNLLTGFLYQVPVWTGESSGKSEEQKNQDLFSLRQTLQEPLNWLVQEAEEVKLLWNKTPPNNPDHRAFASIYNRLITDSIESNVSGQASTNNDQRKLKMHSLVVELVNWQSDERKLRYLFLFSDILVCAKILKNKSGKHRGGLAEMFRGMRASERNRHFRQSGIIRQNSPPRAFKTKDEPNVRLETKWMIPLDQLKLSPNTRVANDPNKFTMHERTIENLKSEISKIRSSVKRLDESKKGAQGKLNRSQKVLRHMEADLVIQSPQLVLPLVEASGQTHYILLVTERERDHWRTALEQEITKARNRGECFKSLKPNSPGGSLGQISDGLTKTGQPRASGLPTIVISQPGTLNDSTSNCRVTAAEMNEFLKKYHNIVRLNKTGMALLDEEPGKTGILRTTVLGIKGLDQLDSYHVCIEVDSFAQFEEVARTHVVAHQDNPQWNETFDLQIDNAKMICFTIYRHADVFAEAEVKLTSDILGGSCIKMPIKTKESPARTIVFTFTVTLRRPSQMVLKGSTPQRGKIFGHTLTDLVRNTSSKNIRYQNTESPTGHCGVCDYDLDKKHNFTRPRVPKIVLACTDEVARRGLREVGIYRICGSNNEIQALKDIFDQDQEEAMKRLATTDIFVVASLLKQFFRELPDSLLTTEGSSKLMYITEMTDDSARMTALQQWLEALPRAHRDTLIHMLSHLLTVSRYSERNMMDVGNLALLWSAALFPPLADSLSEKTPQIGEEDIYIETLRAFQRTKAVHMLLRAVSDKHLRHCEHLLECVCDDT